MKTQTNIYLKSFNFQNISNNNLKIRTNLFMETQLPPCICRLTYRISLHFTSEEHFRFFLKRCIVVISNFVNFVQSPRIGTVEPSDEIKKKHYRRSHEFSNFRLELEYFSEMSKRPF